MYSRIARVSAAVLALSALGHKMWLIRAFWLTVAPVQAVSMMHLLTPMSAFLAFQMDALPAGMVNFVTPAYHPCHRAQDTSVHVPQDTMMMG